MRSWRGGVAALFAVIAVVALAWRWGHANRVPPPDSSAPPSIDKPSSRDADRPEPLPHRVVVEVLNAGGISGAARVATVRLRWARLDVVDYGNADQPTQRSATEVLVRRGDTTGVGRVLEALGTARIVMAPDSGRLVDLSVILGRDFAPTGRSDPHD